MSSSLLAIANSSQHPPTTPDNSAGPSKKRRTDKITKSVPKLPSISPANETSSILTSDEEPLIESPPYSPLSSRGKSPLQALHSNSTGCSPKFSDSQKRLPLTTSTKVRRSLLSPIPSETTVGSSLDDLQDENSSPQSLLGSPKSSLEKNQDDDFEFDPEMTYVISDESSMIFNRNPPYLLVETKDDIRNNQFTTSTPDTTIYNNSKLLLL